MPTRKRQRKLERGGRGMNNTGTRCLKVSPFTGPNLSRICARHAESKNWKKDKCRKRFGGNLCSILEGFGHEQNLGPHMSFFGAPGTNFLLGSPWCRPCAFTGHQIGSASPIAKSPSSKFPSPNSVASQAAPNSRRIRTHRGHSQIATNRKNEALDNNFFQSQSPTNHFEFSPIFEV